MIKHTIKRLANHFGYQVSRIQPQVAPTPVPAPAPATSINADDFHLLPKAGITYSHDLLYTFHNCDFIQEPKFRASYNLGRATDVNNTVLHGDNEIYWRIHVLCWAAAHAAKLEGDFVDCGVNTGIFSRAIINYTDFNATGKKYYLLDTFTGLDPRYSTEQELAQDLNKNYIENRHTLYDQVLETFRGFNVKIIKGAVPDVLPQADTERIAFLSIDMNCVQPEVDALEFFWDKMVSGGIIILDDYGYGNVHNDQKIAHDAFAASKGVEILTLPTCQGMMIKP